MIALFKNHYEIVQILIDNGADINIVDKVLFILLCSY